MTTISEFSDNLPNLINEVLRNNMLEKLEPELKKKMFDSKDDIVFDFDNNTFEVVGVTNELAKEIMEDLKSKK
jgi:hypothetical protein